MTDAELMQFKLKDYIPNIDNISNDDLYKIMAEIQRELANRNRRFIENEG